jgi:hypothetical protein
VAHTCLYPPMATLLMERWEAQGNSTPACAKRLKATKGEREQRREVRATLKA